MHKKIVICLLSFILLFGFIGIAQAAPIVAINGKQLNLDVPPVTYNGTTLVPMRAVFEALGASVFWDGSNNTVTVMKGETVIQLKINSNTGMVNGIKKPVAIPAMLIDGSTMIPIRFVAENMNCTVNWNGNINTIEIRTSNTNNTNNNKSEITPPKTTPQTENKVNNTPSILNNTNQNTTIPLNEKLKDTQQIQATEDKNEEVRNLILNKMREILKEGTVGYWSDENSYKLELSNKQNEIQTCQNKINALSLDNSDYAKSLRTKLNQEIEPLKEELKEIQAKRGRQLRYENLREQLDKYR